MKRIRSIGMGIVAALCVGQIAQAGLPLSVRVTAGRTHRGDVMPITAQLSSSCALPVCVPVACIVGGPNLPPRTIGVDYTGYDGRAHFYWRVSTNPNVDNNSALVITGGSVFTPTIGFLDHLPIG